MKNQIAELMIVIGVLLLPVFAGADPSLGVIDTDLLATYDGTGHSFPYPGDGDITVWWGDDSGSADKTANIYLVTDAGTGHTFTIGTTTFNLDLPIFQQADGYKPIPYYALNLGSVGSPLVGGSWVDATAPYLTTGGKDFYTLRGTFGGSGLTLGDWIFAIADTNHNGIVFENGQDDFSPQTTSTTEAPEPATMLLFVSGLIGLAGYGRKKFFKKEISA